jgi:hypothetical protein
MNKAGWLFAAMVLWTVPACADGELAKLLTDVDQKRLDHFEATRTGAVAEAMAEGAPEDVAILKAALSGRPLSFARFDATGTWSCRTIKLGGMAPPLVVYARFRCRIGDDGAGLQLEKLGGSQRTRGRFYTESDTRLVYLGSGFIAGDKPRPYGSGLEWDQVAVAERLAGNRLVLQFPSPYAESAFDLLVLER